MMMSPKAPTAFLLLLLSSYNPISGFSATNKNKKNAPQTSNVSDLQMKRSTFVQQIMTSASLLVLSPSSPAFAKEMDPAVKGTKKDPKYESCVSSCMFECTKPKGDEQKSRSECLPGCKKQCATSKEQLMIGTPKSAAS